MRILKRLATGTLATAVSITVTSAALAQSVDILSAITAGRVAVISDGDYIARTYADSALPPEEAGHADMLTVLSIADGRVTKSAISVSNSVTAAPEILELTPDGRNAFVTERLGQRPDGARTARDLPAGNRVFAIDLSDAANPRLADTAEIGINPESLAVSPDGRTIAIVSNTSQASLLQIVEFSDGRFGDVAKFDLAALGIEGSTKGARGGVTATNVQWHPSGRYLAVNINTQDRIAFFEFRNAEAGPSVHPWGDTVAVGRDPFVGRFTPDGRHYLTSNWGRNIAATSLDGRIPKASSTMTVIRLAGPETANARHEQLGTIETGVSAEGMAVSPDGRMVATINMQGTSFPEDSPRHQREAAVSLLTFDPRTSTLTKVGDFAFEGVLPEGGTFDLAGDHLLTTVFEGHRGAGPDAGAGIEVFRVVKGNMPALERLGRVALPHGVHHVDIAP
ncbi:lactonase family protein [Rhizobium viscosum]|uniref:Lactonase family protein n=1 Tax=Rhizobium viscosum TaxID=1673 RepID=A0ABR9J093_RHIVS|nr:PD40 domain-containing protein [Rhizobium viscosum]MBE1508477.1 hypothetical protein [Rhizobium viscosum]